MDKKEACQIIHDHELNGLSYRSLGKKYGICHTTIFRMLNSKQKKQSISREAEVTKAEEILPGDEKALREKLRKLELENDLLNLMLDISSKELGVDLRKKHGTRQSK